MAKSAQSRLKAAATTRSLMRLPPRAAPVARGASRAPWQLRVSGSKLGCAECFYTCRELPGPLQSMCVSLCRRVCTG